MTLLLHEVCEELSENGQTLESLCLAGPDGEAFRSTLNQGARMVATFEAATHAEAMSKFYLLYGRGEYVTNHSIDYNPYPEEWRARQ